MRVSEVLLVVLHMLPAAWVAATLEGPPLWLLGSLLLSLLILWWIEHHGVIQRLTGLLASAMLGLLNAMLAASYYFQGGGFNSAFFYHANATGLRVGYLEYRLVLAACLGYLLGSVLLPLVLPKRTWALRRIPVAVALVIGLATYAPLVSLAAYVLDRAREEHPNLPRGNRPRAEIQRLPTERPPRNILLIYGESIEQLYFDQDLFGDLLPGLRELKDRALVFDNIRTAPNTGWTAAALIATQCALPLTAEVSGNTVLSSVDVPFPDQNCFADVLSAYGYETVYINGAPLDFGGKGNFLRAHGYRQVLGRDDLTGLLPDPRYVTGWGLFDDSLFELVADKLAELQAGTRPFLLTVLTLDTHHPRGHPSASCRDFGDNDNEILDAVHCTDQIVSRFITEVLVANEDPDLLIAFVSDHLAMRNTAWEILKQHKQRRRLTFFVLGSGIEPGTISARGTPFDIAPTLLELAGVPNYHAFNLGSSLVSGADGYWYHNRREARERARTASYLGEELVLDSGVVFGIEGPVIRIGERRFVPNYDGYSLEGNIFGIIFDRDRRFKGIASAETLERFEAQVGDSFVLAVSRNPEFKLRFGADSPEAELYCYAGFPSREGHVFEPLRRQVRLRLDRLEALFQGS